MHIRIAPFGNIVIVGKKVAPHCRGGRGGGQRARASAEKWRGNEPINRRRRERRSIRLGCFAASVSQLFLFFSTPVKPFYAAMREIVHIQAGQCGNQIGAKVRRHLASLQNNGALHKTPGARRGRHLVQPPPGRRSGSRFSNRAPFPVAFAR